MIVSVQEQRRRKIAGYVMTEAWRLYKQYTAFTLCWRTTLKLSWGKAKGILRFVHTKVRGASFGNRQELLRRLSLYPSTYIYITLQREPDNPADPNAVAVIAHVRNKGSGGIGYLSRELAAAVAPVIANGAVPVVIFDGVTGGGDQYYGCNFRFALI
jgi:hypothetical protein